MLLRMVLPVLALVLVMPQIVGYLLVRWSARAGVAEWLAAAVATYSGIWYVAIGATLRAEVPSQSGYHCGLGWMLGWGALLIGLGYQILIGGVLAWAVVDRKRARSG
jgi:hypothetical protein